MTNQLSDERFDRQLREFLDWHAGDVGAAPAAAEMAARLRAHAGSRTFGLTGSQHLAWIVLAGLLILGLLAAAAVGSQLLRSQAVVPPPTALADALVPSPTALADAPTAAPLTTRYEAVFVRWEAVDGLPRNPDLVAISVDSDGREREIGRIRQTGMNHISGLFYPRAAVSTTGLLVYPRPISDGPVFEPSGVPRNFRWEIVDLTDAEASAIVVDGVAPDYDQLGPVPAILPGMPYGGAFWGPDERLAIGWRDRAADSDTRLTFVNGRNGAATTADVPESLLVLPYWVSDGSGVFVTQVVYLPEAATDLFEEWQILRPDGSVELSTVAPASICRTQYQPGTRVSLLDPAGGTGFECLAPDESALVLNRVRDTGPVETNPFPRQWARLTQTQSDTSFEIEGAFAGWLEVSSAAD